MVQGIIFDFDGLILDTELSSFLAWQEVYRRYGCSLPVSEFAASIGSVGSRFDPFRCLQDQLGELLDEEAIRAYRRQRRDEILAVQSVLPGVEACIADAKRLNLKLGIASSSPREWVEGHLSRLGLLQHFNCIKCIEDVAEAKPHPELYLAVLDELAVPAHLAIALEDSPSGVLAAKRAGLFCVAVPGPMTRQLSFSEADFQLTSLAETRLEELIYRRMEKTFD